MTAVRALLALLGLVSLGDGILRWLLPDHVVDGASRTALAWLAGCGAGSVTLFALLLAGVPLPFACFAVAVLGLAGLAIASVRRRHTFRPTRRPRRLGAFPLALGGVAVAAFVLGLGASLARPLFAWDAWVNWSSKALVLVRDGGLTPALHADPARLATNPGYPILLPLLEAHLFTVAGSEDPRLAAILPVLFHGALLVLLHAAVRRFGGETAACGAAAIVALTPLVACLVPAGLADPLVAAFVAGAFLLLARLADARSLDPGTAAVAGLLVGSAAFTKSEGGVWAAIAAAAFAVCLSRASVRDGGRAHIIRSVAAFLVPAIAPVAAWQLFLRARGTVGYAFRPLALASLADAPDRLPSLVATVGRHLLSPGWGFVWPTMVLVLLVRRRAALHAKDGLLVGAPLLFLAIVPLAFLLSRFDPWLPHVVNSIDRLTLQAFPLAVWWLAAQAVDSGALGRSDDPNEDEEAV